MTMPQPEPHDARPPALPRGDIEIESSAMPVAIGVLSGISMAVLSAIVAFRPSADGDKTNLVLYAGYGGLLIAIVATAFHIWRASRNSGAVVTLTETGIRDTRVAPQEIPWSAIYSLSTWDFRRQRSLILGVDPDVEAQLSMTHLARWSRIANKRYGGDGICITAAGLRIDHDSLRIICEDRIARANAEAP
jgi:hypothetical protein